MNTKCNSLSIIGFGNQARAWGMNLRDSGVEVTYYLREGSSSFTKAKELGFNALEISDLTDKDPIALLTPDDSHKNIIARLELTKDSVVIIAHGYSLLYEDIQKLTPAQFLLFAPKAIASELRFQFEIKGSNAGVYDKTLAPSVPVEWIEDLAIKMGINSLSTSSIKEETIADLYSEQTLLCGLIPYACLEVFNRLKAQGFSSEASFYECWHELKLIVNTLVEIGPEKFFELISPNALLGADIGKELVYSNDFQTILDQLMINIKDGSFAKKASKTDFHQLRQDIQAFWSEQELNKTHKKLQPQLYPKRSV